MNDSTAAPLGERVARLGQLWRSVTSRPLHPVGCTCMGHFLIPAMNAKDMEADILDYMRGRYAGEGFAALVALLDAREAEREGEAPCLSFRAWLLRLPEVAGDAAALDRFLTDLQATLESFMPVGGNPGGGLICI